MPELPEVETIRRGLQPRLQGKSICAVIVRRRDLRYPLPPGLSQKINGCVFATMRRRGKYLLADIKNTKGKIQTLIIHLGMTGALFFAARKPAKAEHEHIGLLLSDGDYLIYRDPRRFGCILLSSDADNHPRICTIGIEPLSSGFDGKFLHKQWRGKKTPIKTALMNSGVIAGVGNIYASESLFIAGIHPHQQAGNLTAAQCAKVAAAVKQILQKALRAGGSTIRNFINSNGESGHFQMQWQVYDRADKKCNKCKAHIVASRQNNRTTYYCPNCQR